MLIEEAFETSVRYGMGDETSVVVDDEALSLQAEELRCQRTLLVVGAIGGIANALLVSQAKKEFKANSKILEDATYTVESETTEEKKDSDSDDTVKY